MIELLAAFLLGQFGATCHGYDLSDLPSKRRPRSYDWCGSALTDPYNSGTTPRMGIDVSLGARYIQEGGDSGNLPENRAPTMGELLWNQDAFRFLHSKRRSRAATLGKQAPSQYLAARFDLLTMAELERGVRRGDLPWKCLVESEDTPAATAAVLASNDPDYQINWTYLGDGTADTNSCRDEDGNAIGCEFVVSTNGGATPSATGEGLLKELCAQDATCATGDPNTAYQKVVYLSGRYLVDRHNGAAEPIEDPDGDELDEVSWTALEFKLGDPDCNAWAVADTIRQMQQGGFDGVYLLHKSLHYYWSSTWTKPPTFAASAWRSEYPCTTDAGAGCTEVNWMGADTGPNPDGVSENQSMDEMIVSSVPKGCARADDDLAGDPPTGGQTWDPDSADDAACSYRYTDYWSGMKEIADALTAAQVPYSFLPGEQQLNPTNTGQDDPGTVTDERSAYLWPIAAGATLLHADFSTTTTAEQDTATLAAFPSAQPVDTACGQHGTASVACNGSLGTNVVDFVVPELSLADDGTVTWKPYNGAATPTPAGTWDGTLWCDCPGASADQMPTLAVCGVAADDAVAAVADGTPDTKLCPAAPGDRIAATVTQGGETFWTWYDVP